MQRHPRRRTQAVENCRARTRVRQGASQARERRRNGAYPQEGQAPHRPRRLQRRRGRRRRHGSRSKRHLRRERQRIGRRASDYSMCDKKQFKWGFKARDYIFGLAATTRYLSP